LRLSVLEDALLTFAEKVGIGMPVSLINLGVLRRVPDGAYLGL
jgi:hypothetical protein